MVNKITVELHNEEPSDTHFVIYDDGVVRTRLPVSKETDKVRVVIVSPSEQDISDAQCQSASVTVTACGLRYGVNEIKGVGLKWADILRRG